MEFVISGDAVTGNGEECMTRWLGEGTMAANAGVWWAFALEVPVAVLA